MDKTAQATDRDDQLPGAGPGQPIGEHTDYSGGLVLPVAIDRYVTVTGRGG